MLGIKNAYVEWKGEHLPNLIRMLILQNACAASTGDSTKVGAVSQEIWLPRMFYPRQCWFSQPYPQLAGAGRPRGPPGMSKCEPRRLVEPHFSGSQAGPGASTPQALPAVLGAAALAHALVRRQVSAALPPLGEP